MSRPPRDPATVIARQERERRAAEAMSPKARASLDYIVGLVTDDCRVARADVFSPRRGIGAISEARQLAMYLAHHYAQPGPDDTISSLLPGYFNRDRATVAWAVKTVNLRLTWDKKFQRRVAKLSDMIRQAYAINAVSELP
jgi:chromosomal replication initiation ATPase DnaA